jgi:hypothetical protein
MLNMKDEYLAQERYADLRREAEAHNAAARLRKQGCSGEKTGRKALRTHNILGRWMHKFLRGGAGAHNQTAVNLR